MTESLDLHTFARRYCIDRIAYWHNKYRPIERNEINSIGSGRHKTTDAAYDIFPRYNILAEILLSVETLDSDNLPEFKKLAELLSNFGHSAKSDFTSNHDNSTAHSAEQEERYTFIEAVEKAAADGPGEQLPLPYRRVLAHSEVEQVRSDIATIWGATDDYWYPLREKSHPSLVAFDLGSIDEKRFLKYLCKFLSFGRDEKIFELREYGPSYQLDGRLAHPQYNGAEGYWCSPSNEWIVYCSHENTVTLGGTAVNFAIGKFKPLTI
ncbi:hypothetical protein [Roseibium suaedae]|uniref:Uncharacterized protein n=1 Tax=Roseibium suaedae TaxID=735517 RepID=A0A1M7PBN4_9HYPH|nr:hypothetical protein [Roseibium suaedae]SHN13758.1 hypothetical protein SAMN05444272_4266 [Roseibium suaedae]